MADALTLEFKNEVSRLEMKFTPGEGRTFGMVVHIRQSALDLTFSSGCFGYDLAEFARELESLHSSYGGCARFINQNGDTQIELSLVHPGRGIIGVVAILEQWFSWPADYAPLRQQGEPRHLKFQGFTIEQSYLPSLVRQIREFLTETGVSTNHPMTSGSSG